MLSLVQLCTLAAAVSGLSLKLPLHARRGGFGWRYLVDLELGTPAQRASLLLDTGTHLLLLRDAALGACASGEPAAYGDCFNSSASSTLLFQATDDDAPPPLRFAYVIDQEDTLQGSSRAVSDLVRFVTESASPWENVTSIGMVPPASSGELDPPDLSFFWADAAGALGSPPHAEVNGGAFAALIAPYDSTFALDANRDEGESLMYLGRPHIDTLIAGGLEWAETRAVAELAEQMDFHTLSFFEPTVCGAMVFGEASNHLEAMIDTGSSCLGLHSDVFDHFFSWVPARCTGGETMGGDFASADTTESDGPPRRRCYLPAGTAAEELPVLTFRLHERGHLFSLPLERLLLPATGDSGDREFCVRRYLVTSSEAPRTPILLGTMFVDSFIVAFESTESGHRAGLAPKLAPLGVADLQLREASCAAAVRCRGEEVHEPWANRCVAAECGDYERLVRWDGSFCRPPSMMVAVVLTLVCALAVAELLMQRVEGKLASRIKATQLVPAQVRDGERAGGRRNYAASESIGLSRDGSRGGSWGGSRGGSRGGVAAAPAVVEMEMVSCAAPRTEFS